MSDYFKVIKKQGQEIKDRHAAIRKDLLSRPYTTHTYPGSQITVGLWKFPEGVWVAEITEGKINVTTLKNYEFDFIAALFLASDARS